MPRRAFDRMPIKVTLISLIPYRFAAAPEAATVPFDHPLQVTHSLVFMADTRPDAVIDISSKFANVSRRRRWCRVGDDGSVSPPCRAGRFALDHAPLEMDS